MALRLVAIIIKYHILFAFYFSTFFSIHSRSFPFSLSFWCIFSACCSISQKQKDETLTINNVITYQFDYKNGFIRLLWPTRVHSIHKPKRTKVICFIFFISRLFILWEILSQSLWMIFLHFLFRKAASKCNTYTNWNSSWIRIWQKLVWVLSESCGTQNEYVVGH